MQTKTIYLFTLFLCLVFPLPDSWAQDAGDAGEETYTISLTQTAEINKEIVEIDDKKVLTERYSVQEGDHLWQLLRERDLLKKKELPDILAILKNLNSNLENLDLIHPGQTIIIPLVISPAKGMPVAPRKVPPEAIAIKDLEGMEMENFTVQSGDSLIKIIQDHYDIPKNYLYDEYLTLVKGLNPSIEDLDTIYPGQKIRLPIYSPQIVRKPIEATPAPASKSASKTPPESKPIPAALLGKKLGDLFKLLGAEWIHTGEHFIPIKSGGQLKLEAESFPMLGLSNGNRVIIDLKNDLPQDMALLISSSWENYRVVHLEKSIRLREALSRIIPSCGYPKVFRLGEAFEQMGDIHLTITADWIIQAGPDLPEGKDRIFMITIMDDSTAPTPHAIGDFLAKVGIRVIDYPPPPAGDGVKTREEVAVLRPDHDAYAVINMVMQLTGQKFSQNVEIPLYPSNKTGFDLILNADFLINIDGKDSIIDLSGMGPDVLSLLQEHGFNVLSLGGERDPLSVVRRTLEFVGLGYDPGPHSFMATQREESRNIRMTIPGVVFMDSNGAPVFATPLGLPETVERFVASKGYQILELALASLPAPTDQGAEGTVLPTGKSVEEEKGGAVESFNKIPE